MITSDNSMIIKRLGIITPRLVELLLDYYMITNDYDDHLRLGVIKSGLVGLLLDY